MGRLIAHRGMPGALQNTREGVRRALELGYEAVEVDVVLSKDDRLVLSHDPWLHPEYVEGGGEDQLIGAMSWDEIRERRVSGQAAMELTELLQLLPAEVALYLDVKIELEETRLTRPAGAYAKAIFSAWTGQVPLMLEAPSAAIAATYRTVRPDGYTTYLSWPRYTVTRGGLGQTLEANWMELIGRRDPLREVRAAGVDGYTAHRVVAQPKEIKAAAAAGVEVVVFGVNKPGPARRLQALGAHVIVDHAPGLPG